MTGAIAWNKFTISVSGDAVQPLSYRDVNPGISDYVVDLAASPTLDYVAAGLASTGAAVLKIANNRLENVSQAKLHAAALSCVRFDPEDPAVLLSCGFDGSVKAWDSSADVCSLEWVPSILMRICSFPTLRILSVPIMKQCFLAKWTLLHLWLIWAPICRVCWESKFCFRVMDDCSYLQHIAAFPIVLLLKPKVITINEYVRDHRLQ